MAIDRGAIPVRGSDRGDREARGHIAIRSLRMPFDLKSSTAKWRFVNQEIDLMFLTVI